MKIEMLDIAREMVAVGDLIRLAFSEVADRLGFTRENSPGFTAFASDEKLLAQLGREETLCFGIREAGKWVGFVAVAPHEEEWIITRLAVRPEFQHRGYGRLLMDAACDAAREMGLTEIGLGVVNENMILKKWYEAQGLVADEIYPVPGAAYAVCAMSKTL
jgi:ribosomal protein S18 acetylase RimI-like enzyme